MSLHQPQSDLELPPEEVKKFLQLNSLERGSLLLSTEDWGRIKMSIVHERKKIDIDPADDLNERWKVRLPRKTDYQPYSWKDGRKFFTAPAVVQKGIVRTIGLCRMNGLIVDEESFVRYFPLSKHDQAASITSMTTPDAPFSTLSLAVVEMEEPTALVENDLIREFQGEEGGIHSAPFDVRKRTLKNVRGIFQIGIQSPQ